MFIPALIALAATAAGTGLQMDANRRAGQAMNDRTADELRRQRRYQQESDPVFHRSLAESSPAATQRQMDEGAAARLAAMQAVSAVPQTFSPLETPSESQVAGTNAQLMQQALARAKVGGYSDWDLRQWIKDLKARQELATISQFANRSNEVLPYELQDAARSSSTESALGGLLSQAGMMTMMMGLKGSNAAAQPSNSYTANPETIRYSQTLMGPNKQFSPGYGPLA